MDTKTKRILSTLLMVVMLFALIAIIPTTASANSTSAHPSNVTATATDLGVLVKWRDNSNASKITKFAQRVSDTTKTIYFLEKDIVYNGDGSINYRHEYTYDAQGNRLSLKCYKSEHH